MSKSARVSRRIDLESLESRNLLTLIVAKPTLHVINGPGVHNLPSGRVNILQPAEIQVSGTAQPAAPGATATVSIYAEDRHGTIMNNGQPLATTTPDALGFYRTTVSLPSNFRRDINFLVARETASATEVSQLAINGTTFTSTSGSLTDGTGTLAASTSTLSGGTGTLAATTGTLAGGTGTLGASTSTLSGGTGTLAATTGTLAGGTGTLGASTSVLSNGTGTIDPFTGVFTQAGTVTIGGGGVGTIAGLTGNVVTPAVGITGIGGTIANPAGAVTGIGGTITTPAAGITGIGGTIANPGAAVTGIGGTITTPQTAITGITGSIANPATAITGITGTVAVAGTIAPTTGTATRLVQEVAVSDPVTVQIHQRRGTGAVVAPFSQSHEPIVAHKAAIHNHK